MADINDDVYAEIEGNLETIKRLISEGNTEGAEEIESETETMISGLKPVQKYTKQRKAYRDALSEAMKPQEKPAPATELVKPMPTEIADVAGLEDLVAQGAQRVREVAEGKIRGGRAIAELLFQMRTGIILPDGMPDLMARSQAARNASEAIYDRVTADLPAEGTSELSDSIRSEVASIKRSAQTAMNDVRVEFIRSLDGSDGEALEVYASVIRDGIKPSEAVAQHYGIKRLMTRREIEEERRNSAKEIGPAEVLLHKVAAGIRKQLKPLDREEVKALEPDAKAKLRDEIQAQIDALSILLTDLK